MNVHFPKQRIIDNNMLSFCATKLYFEVSKLSLTVLSSETKFPKFTLPTHTVISAYKERQQIFKNRYEELVDAGILVPSDK